MMDNIETTNRLCLFKIWLRRSSVFAVVTGLLKHVLLISFIGFLCLHAKETGYVLELICLMFMDSYKYVLTGICCLSSYALASNDKEHKMLKSLVTGVVIIITTNYTESSTLYVINSDFTEIGKITKHQQDALEWIGFQTQNLSAGATRY